MKKAKQTETIVNGELFLHSKSWLQMVGLCSFQMIIYSLSFSTTIFQLLSYFLIAIFFFAGGVWFVSHTKKKLLKQQKENSEQTKDA